MISGCTQTTNQKRVVVPSSKQIETPVETQPTQQTTSETTNMLTYEDSDAGIRVNYPSEWARQEKLMGTVVSFTTPLEGSSDNFQENVNIAIEDLSLEPKTLEEYTNYNINEIENLLEDVEVLEINTEILAGNEADRLVYTGKLGQYTLKWMQIYTIKDHKAYVITYSAKINTYNEFLNDAEDIIYSFEFI